MCSVSDCIYNDGNRHCVNHYDVLAADTYFCDFYFPNYVFQKEKEEIRNDKTGENPVY